MHMRRQRLAAEQCRRLLCPTHAAAAVGVKQTRASYIPCMSRARLTV